MKGGDIIVMQTSYINQGHKIIMMVGAAAEGSPQVVLTEERKEIIILSSNTNNHSSSSSPMLLQLVKLCKERSKTVKKARGSLTAMEKIRRRALLHHDGDDNDVQVLRDLAMRRIILRKHEVRLATALKLLQTAEEEASSCCRTPNLKVEQKEEDSTAHKKEDQEQQDFTRMPHTHAISVKKEHLNRIRIDDPHHPDRKNTEFRMRGHWTGGLGRTTQQVILFESDRQYKHDPILVDVLDVTFMTAQEAMSVYARDAIACNLVGRYLPSQMVYCISLGERRIHLGDTITLLRPMNIFSVAQFELEERKHSGKANFCLTRDVGKWIREAEGKPLQLLEPNGFAKQ
jgi:hypothetical protein